MSTAPQLEKYDENIQIVKPQKYNFPQCHCISKSQQWRKSFPQSTINAHYQFILLLGQSYVLGMYTNHANFWHHPVVVDRNPAIFCSQNVQNNAVLWRNSCLLTTLVVD